MGRCVAGKALSQYLDGELDPAAAAEVARHLAACPACASAMAEMKAVDAAVREGKMPADAVPDLASRVTAQLRDRGAFFVARVDARRRRLFGAEAAGMRVAMSFALALVVMVGVVAGLDWATQRAWVRRTEPVLADAERVLVRLQLVDLAAEGGALVRAREESQQFALSERLAVARRGAAAVTVGDLAYLESAFSILARGDPLPPDLAAALARGDVLKCAERVREAL